MSKKAWKGHVSLDLTDQDARVYVIAPRGRDDSESRQLALSAIVEAGIRVLLASLPLEDAREATRAVTKGVMQHLSHAVRHEQAMFDRFLQMDTDLKAFESEAEGLVSLRQVSTYLERRLRERAPSDAGLRLIREAGAVARLPKQSSRSRGERKSAPGSQASAA